MSTVQLGLIELGVLPEIGNARVSFTVFGRPQQRGSKQPRTLRRKDGSLVEKNGRPVIVTTDANDKSKPWMAAVSAAAGEVYRGALLTGPIRLTVAFYFARNKGHFGSGRNAGVLKPTAPRRYTQMPDLDKLLRSIGDALTGVVYRDDAQVCCYGEETAKHWTTEQERAEITIEEIA